jgi:hypothetical protein
MSLLLGYYAFKELTGGSTLGQATTNDPVSGSSATSTTTGSNIFSRSVNSFMSGVQARTGLNVTGPYTGSMTPLSQRDTTSAGAADTASQFQFRGSGIGSYDYSPVKGNPEYVSAILPNGNFVIKKGGPRGEVILSHNDWVSDRAYQEFIAAREAAKPPEEVPVVTEPTVTTEREKDISGAGTTSVTAESIYQKSPEEALSEQERLAQQELLRQRQERAIGKASRLRTRLESFQRFGPEGRRGGRGRQSLMTGSRGGIGYYSRFK